MALCPYCKKRPLIKKTCGLPECQVAHKRMINRFYFDKFIRKTDRRVSPSILRVNQQSAELAIK